jgi:hypothetical protein
MRIRKTVTDKVVAANRTNASNSKGPRNTQRVRLNALTHGLLAKHLIFEDEEAKAEFNALLGEFELEYHPFGRTEAALVEEIAVCFWKLELANGWEQAEIANRRKASKAILRSVAANCEDKPLPMFVNDDGSRSPAELGWECRELIVRTGSTSSEQEQTSGGEDSTAKSGNVQIEAKLNTSIDSVLRYSAAIKRDLYRAIGTLRDIQRERRDLA